MQLYSLPHKSIMPLPSPENLQILHNPCLQKSFKDVFKEFLHFIKISVHKFGQENYEKWPIDTSACHNQMNTLFHPWTKAICSFGQNKTAAKYLYILSK